MFSLQCFSITNPINPFSSVKRRGGIDIESVEVHNVETRQEKRGRTLKHLLKLNHANHSILYHRLEFHNHMPHILASAYLMGSDEEHLESIYEEESKSLEKWKDSPGEVSEHDWRDYLGDRRYQRAFVDFFEDQLVLRGYDWRKLIAEYLLQGKEPLINGVFGGLGHPVIHLAYAYEISSRDVAMEAFGLTATCYDFLHKYLDEPHLSKPSGWRTTSPLEILQKVQKDKRFDGMFQHPGPDNLEALFKNHEELVLDYWNSWELPDPKRQFEESQFAAACLLATTQSSSDPSYDFFLVHTLTTSHAVRILLPFLPVEHHVPLVRQWWLFALAVYICQLRPTIDVDSVMRYDVTGKDWRWADSQALNGEWQYDSHFVKAVRSLKEAARTWGDEDGFYLKAAAKFADQFGGWFGFTE